MLTATSVILCMSVSLLGTSFFFLIKETHFSAQESSGNNHWKGREDYDRLRGMSAATEKYITGVRCGHQFSTVSYGCGSRPGTGY